MATQKRLTAKQRLQWWQNTADFYRTAWAAQVRATEVQKYRLTVQVGRWKLATAWALALALGFGLAFGFLALQVGH